jgi:hypothetical protein
VFNQDESGSFGGFLGPLLDLGCIGFFFGLFGILFVYLEALVFWVSFVRLRRFALSLCTKRRLALFFDI